jgi:transposase
VYERPYDPKMPIICIDEKLVELRKDIRKPFRYKGILHRDYEYERTGTANLFMMLEVNGTNHFAKITKRRTAVDFAHCLQTLSNRFQDAITIHLVMDNLNTHAETSCIKAFGELEGRRLWARFTPHFTPKHASWLNQAELALSVTARCALGRTRFGTKEELRSTVCSFWSKKRKIRWSIDWKFTTRHGVDWIKKYGTRH